MRRESALRPRSPVRAADAALAACAARVGLCLWLALVGLARSGVARLQDTSATPALHATAAASEERVREILLSEHERSPASAASAIAALVELGPRAVPAIFAALCATFEAAHASADPSRAAAVPPSASRDALRAVADAPTSVELMAVAALEASPVAVRAQLDASSADDAPLAVRIATLRVVERIGVARDLRLWTKTTVGADTSLPRLSAALERALAATLVRDTTTYAALERTFPILSPASRPIVIAAVVRAHAPHGLRFLSRVLHHDDALRPLVLVAIGRLAGTVSRPIDEDVLASVRRYLVEADPVALPEATLTVGRLDDDEAIPQLIALLKSPARGLRANALWSLQRISGLGIAETPDRWTSWYVAEREWWKAEWPRVQADLRGHNEVRRRVALVAIAPRQLHRHALAVEVAQILADEDGDVATLACATLAQLRSPAGVAVLLDTLEHGDPIVRLAAWNALSTITGKNLPPDPKLWRESLVPR